MTSTDLAWRQWGEQDPYFAVITNPKFRQANLDERAREEFFHSGAHHVRHVLDTCRRHLDPAFRPRSALDFGCGVGRIVVPLAREVAAVTGLDIAPAMLQEARHNCERHGLQGVELLLSDDTLSAAPGPYDLVHSCIVLQHVDVPRGRLLFRELVARVAPGGIGALQVTYAKARHARTWGRPPEPAPAAPPPARRPAPLWRRWLGLDAGHGPASAAPAPLPPAPAPGQDPEMQMNAYPLNDLFFVLQQAGIAQVHTRFTDHGGELGVFLYFRRPAEG